MDKKVMLLIGLAVLAVGSLFYGILTPSKVKRELGPPNETAGPLAASPPQDLIPAERERGRSVYPAWGRNPFRARETAVEGGTRGGLILDGIAWDEKSPKAIVNDRIVGVGDSLGENRVVAIEKNKVVLNDGANDFELRVGRGRSSS